MNFESAPIFDLETQVLLKKNVSVEPCCEVGLKTVLCFASAASGFCSLVCFCLQLLARGGEFLPFEAPRTTSLSPSLLFVASLAFENTAALSSSDSSKCLMSVHFPILIGLSKCIPGLSIPAGVPDKNDLSATFSSTLCLSPQRMQPARCLD